MPKEGLSCVTDGKMYIQRTYDNTGCFQPREDSMPGRNPQHESESGAFRYDEGRTENNRTQAV